MQSNIDRVSDPEEEYYILFCIFCYFRILSFHGSRHDSKDQEGSQERVHSPSGILAKPVCSDKGNVAHFCTEVVPSLAHPGSAMSADKKPGSLSWRGNVGKRGRGLTPTQWLSVQSQVLLCWSVARIPATLLLRAREGRGLCQCASR